MGSLSREVSRKALELGAPFNVQLDITYRCNERCVHCYLDHDDHGEMTTAEIRDVLDQLAAAGAFSLSISGGEILLRKDFFEILAHARSLLFSVRLKTNAILIREAEARRIQRPRRPAGSDQHLFAQGTGPRRHYESTRLTRALRSGDSLPEIARAESHHCQRPDAPERGRLSGSASPGRRTGCGHHN